MRVTVFGASGNVGTRVLDALAASPVIEEIVAVSRRPSPTTRPKVSWRAADIGADDLTPLVRGATAVVHLAWALHPVRHAQALHAVNVVGSRRIFAAAAAEARALVYASSVGAYSPADKALARDESWPTDGVASSAYSRQKAYLERALDALECAHPQLRVVRLRPGLIFQAGAAREIRQLFLGRLLPVRAVLGHRLPLLPVPRGLAFQAVHTSDVADAVVRALTRDVRGAFNLAADPVLTDREIAAALGARPLAVPPALARAAAAASWHLHLQPSEPGWLDLALACPIMDTARARTELGWRARVTSTAALAELLAAIDADEAAATAQLRAPAGASTADA